MAKINVTLRDDVLAELDVLVEASARGSRSAAIAGLIRGAYGTWQRVRGGRTPRPEPRGGEFSKVDQAGKAKR